MKTIRSAATLALAAVLGIAAVACSDDGASVTEIDGTDSSASSGPSGGSGGGSGSGSASGSGATPSCQPVGDEADATSTLAVDLGEWFITPESDSFAGGAVNIIADNIGVEPHELVIVRGDDPAALPIDDDGAFDESAFPEEEFLGEIEGFPAGEDCNGVFDLEPGEYIWLCNLVEVEADGELESHFAEGMFTTVTVTE